MNATITPNQYIPTCIIDNLRLGLTMLEVGALIGEDPESTAPEGVDPKEWAAVLHDFVDDIDVLDPAASNAAVLDWIEAYLPEVAAVLTDAEVKLLAEGIESMV